MRFTREEATAIHQKWIGTGVITPGECVEYFQNVRKVLEHVNPPTRLPTLSTYCDWMAHSNLNRSKHFAPLKRTTVLFSKGKQLPNFHDDIVNGFLNTHGLVREMQMFNLIYAIDTLQGENEEMLLQVLSERLEGSPISCLKQRDPITWAFASKKLGLTHTSIVYSGSIIRNHVLDEIGCFSYKIRLEIVRKDDDQLNGWEFEYMRIFPQQRRREMRVNLDAYSHPMYHSHPIFPEIGNF